MNLTFSVSLQNFELSAGCDCTKRSNLETQQSLHNLFLHNMGLDPINPNIIGHHRSPIPNRKRAVNLVEQPVTPTLQSPPITRRASLDPIGPIDPIGHHSPILFVQYVQCLGEINTDYGDHKSYIAIKMIK